MTPVQAEEVADHAALLALVRVELRREPEQAECLVNSWFDLHSDAWVAAVLGAELGSHQPHFEVYRMLTVDRRAALVGRAASSCLREGRRGLVAGAFMVGRFVSAAQPVAFWNRLSDQQVAFALDEWTQYIAYLALLDQVGERKLRLARQRIEESGLEPATIRRNELLVFMSLKLSERSLEQVARSLGARPNSEIAVALLREPYGKFFNYALPWSLGRLQQICDEASLPLPDAEAS